MEMEVESEGEEEDDESEDENDTETPKTAPQQEEGAAQVGFLPFSKCYNRSSTFPSFFFSVNSKRYREFI